MKKLLLVLSLFGVMGLQASASDSSNSSDLGDVESRGTSTDSGVVVSPVGSASEEGSDTDSCDKSESVFIAPEDCVIEITLVNGQKVKESPRQLQWKFNNLFFLVEVGHKLYEHDRVHMKAILDSSPEKAQKLLELAEGLAQKYPRQFGEETFYVKSVYARNFGFLDKRMNPKKSKV
jgi:hypothetical protein